MSEAVQRLIDVEAIKQLKARYFRLLDTRQWEAWGEVFAVDVHMEVPEAAVELDGREAVVHSVSAALAGATTVHHGHTPEIELTGPDTAVGTWAMADIVEWPATDGGEPVGIRGYGHYTETYVRDGDRWRIATTRLVRLRVDPL